MNHRRGFSSNLGRERKAIKIQTILRETRKKDITDEAILDIGTGNGAIASYFGDISSFVTSVDIEDERTVHGRFEFRLIQNEVLPFHDESFDIVISNHVIEHLNNQPRHIAEISRVLRPNGVAYLATPNRLWPWEFHYRIPLLHYLPLVIFTWLLKTFGKYKERVMLLSYFKIHRLLKSHFDCLLYSDRVIKQPSRYGITCPINLDKLLNSLPLGFYTLIAGLHPTLIFVLRKKTDY
jgi:SAM-dependent methyltransferase